jgi:hypothetical protein
MALVPRERWLTWRPEATWCARAPEGELEAIVRRTVWEFLRGTAFRALLRLAYGTERLIVLCLDQCAVHECGACNRDKPGALTPVVRSADGVVAIAYSAGCLACKTQPIIDVEFIRALVSYHARHGCRSVDHLMDQAAECAATLRLPILSWDGELHSAARSLPAMPRIWHSLLQPAPDGLDVTLGRPTARFLQLFRASHICPFVEGVYDDFVGAEWGAHPSAMFMLAHVAAAPPPACPSGLGSPCFQRQPVLGLAWWLEYQHRVAQPH